MDFQHLLESLNDKNNFFFQTLQEEIKMLQNNYTLNEQFSS